jgi:triacylglycerol esterase/lipase EstA (alpha/beta hydrolase family)
MKRSPATLLLVSFIFGCGNPSIDNIQLSDFEKDTSVQKLGKQLMVLSHGLNALESNLTNANEVFIGVHGSNSEGYEWVYPLKILNTNKKEIYFYRWPDNSCYQAPAENLILKIEDLLDAHPNIQKITLMGHSYGGIVVSYIVENWSNKIMLEAHIIASPLRGTAALIKRCNFEELKKIKNNVVLFEWRTQQELDNAFKGFETNPQDINISGSYVTTLPDMYKGNRLGHNWSISWVADQIK